MSPERERENASEFRGHCVTLLQTPPAQRRSDQLYSRASISAHLHWLTFFHFNSTGVYLSLRTVTPIKRSMVITFLQTFLTYSGSLQVVLVMLFL